MTDVKKWNGIQNDLISYSDILNTFNFWYTGIC